MLPILLMFACAPRPSVVDTRFQETDEPIETDETDTDIDTDETDTDVTDTEESGKPDTGTIPYDCSDLPAAPLVPTELDRARGYHDVIFDAEGHIIGWDGNSLVKVTYDNQSELFVPGLRDVQGMEHLAGDDIVIVDPSRAELTRITPEGATSTLASDIGPGYGVTRGPDGMLYVANIRAVLRVDPADGSSVVLFNAPRNASTHVVNFNLDSTRMYVGTIGQGTVYYMDLDEDLNPVGELQVFAKRVGRGWHDGLGVDVCGNLYVADYSSSSLYRVTPEAEVTLLYQARPATTYGHGLEWGSGIGGWRADALYLPQPYDGNTVMEVVIGMPNGNSVRTWAGDK